MNKEALQSQFMFFGSIEIEGVEYSNIWADMKSETVHCYLPLIENRISKITDDALSLIFLKFLDLLNQTDYPLRKLKSREQTRILKQLQDYTGTKLRVTFDDNYSPAYAHIVRITECSIKDEAKLIWFLLRNA